MRKLQRPKFHRHLLVSAAIVGMIVTTAAFARGPHASAYSSNSSSRSMGHAGFGNRHLINADSRSGKRNDNQSLVDAEQNQSMAATSNPRRHERVPDEEELGQAEQ